MDKYVLIWATNEEDGLACGHTCIGSLQYCRTKAKAIIDFDADPDKPIYREPISTTSEFYEATLKNGGELVICIEKI